MVTFVLDASAVIRFLDGEAGADRVREIFHLKRSKECSVVISAINWGEVLGKLSSRSDISKADDYMSNLAELGLEVIDASASRARRAALVKVAHHIPYADAFGVELACDSMDHVLVTADFDVRPAEHLIRIEFLPVKPKL